MFHLGLLVHYTYFNFLGLNNVNLEDLLVEFLQHYNVWP